MSVIATAVAALIEAGVSGDALVAAIAKMEAAQASAAIPTRTARQERNARYYEARKARLEASKTSESVLSKTIKTVSDGGAAQERVPRPLKETTHEDTPSEAKASSSPRGRRQPKSELCPENFEPSEAHYGKAEAAGRDRAFVLSIAGRMFRWSRQNATRKIAKKSDWSMALHDWIDRALEEGRPIAQARASPQQRLSGPTAATLARKQTRDSPDEPALNLEPVLRPFPARRSAEASEPSGRDDRAPEGDRRRDLKGGMGAVFDLRDRRAHG